MIFVKQDLEKEDNLSFNLAEEFAVLFINRGSVIIELPNHQKLRIRNKQIVLLSNYSNYNLTAKSDADLTVLYFERPGSRCDLLRFDKMKSNAYDKNGQLVRTLKMNKPLQDFVKYMDFYLERKMYCRHLHEIKESEFFFLVRAFYTKEDIAYFFDPVVRSLNDFTNQVKGNYMKVESVRELAEICNMTTKTFTRKFKATFHQTPKQWMMTEKAKFGKKRKPYERKKKSIIGIYR